jgi:uncharacterized protein (DUF433 family)
MPREGRRVEANREIARRAGGLLQARIERVLEEMESGCDLDQRIGEHRLAVLLGALRSVQVLGRRRFRAGAKRGRSHATDPRDVWRNRLIIDSEVSPSSPVVRGTWVTVAQVVSLVIDGWSWDRILHAFPELTTDDIRACLSYSVEGSA